MALAKTDQVEAIDSLLQKSLGVRNDDEILLIYDDSFFPYMDAFTDCVNARDFSATYLYIPKSYQLRLAEAISRKSEQIWLPDPLRSAVLASSVILNVLDGDLNTAPVRGAVLAQLRSKGCRLAAATNWRVEAILHGHEHQPSVTWAQRWAGQNFDGTPQGICVIGAGSCGAARDQLGPVSKNQYYLLVKRQEDILIRSRVIGDDGIEFMPHNDILISNGSAKR
jgi:hypothetical protein